jgi:5,5'-dehydrodivanillate O-demethylase
MLDAQDIMAWVTQGPVADRSVERLATADRGVVQFRKMLRRELDRVAAGQDPMGVVRDPALNERIEIPLERNKHHFSDGFERMVRKNHVQYAPILDELIAVFAA